MSTPTGAAERKALPLASGVLDYFPDALMAVAECSRVGNEQHNPGQPLHWAKEKSTDEADALLRHLIDRGTVDTDGVRHSAKVAWRALAMLQRELDAEAAVEAEATAYLTYRGMSLSGGTRTAYMEPERLTCDWPATGVHDPWCSKWTS